MSSVLRLGVYRERIEKYGVRRKRGSVSSHQEQILTVTLERQPGRHLGIRYHFCGFTKKINFLNFIRREKNFTFYLFSEFLDDLHCLAEDSLFDEG